MHIDPHGMTCSDQPMKVSSGRGPGGILEPHTACTPPDSPSEQIDIRWFGHEMTVALCVYIFSKTDGIDASLLILCFATGISYDYNVLETNILRLLHVRPAEISPSDLIHPILLAPRQDEGGLAFEPPRAAASLFGFFSTDAAASCNFWRLEGLGRNRRRSR